MAQRKQGLEYEYNEPGKTESKKKKRQQWSSGENSYEKQAVLEVDKRDGIKIKTQAMSQK